MAATAGTITVYEQDTGNTLVSDSPFEYKEILVHVSDVADDTDTVAVTLANHGLTTFKYIKGYTHSTEGSIIIEEAPTTAVSSGVLTITIGGSTDNKARVFIVGGI
ncbi:MAG TPA: hypothetical protein DHN29_14440 [Cytophagales bacterium]|jgi:hypothetical protein|nr:hypothetical protein [Cytophagales bacterium]|tara:strand:- start:619 stop:936 length:318 start_codon:yes stop_codon:yes gene_type:complete